MISFYEADVASVNLFSTSLQALLLNRKTFHIFASAKETRMW